MGREDHDLMEHILSLLKFLQSRGIPVDRCTQREVLTLLPDDSELRTAYEMLRFMEKIPGGFMIYQADGEERIVYANSGLLRVLRCDDWAQFQALTGGVFRGLVHPEDLQEVERSIERQIASSRYDLDYVEYRVLRRDGTVGWIEDYGHFVHGESVGDFFYVFLGDATEKQERQRSEREKAEQRFQGMIQEYDRERSLIDQEYLRRLEVIEGLSVNYESILYAELEKNRIRAYRLSSRTARQFGEKYRMKELRWYLTDYVNTWVHPEDKEMVAEETDPAYIRKKLSESGNYYINYRVIFQGQVQYIQLRIVNVTRGNRVDQIVLGYRRVDEELKQEMQQKQILAEALKSANLAIAARDEFLSNISHDMRTPLNAIFGFAALAKRKLQEPETVRNYLDRVETSGKQLLDLIDKVLEAAWAGAQEQWSEEEWDLCGAVEEACGLLRNQARGKNLSFVLDCSGVSHRRVQGDREKLKQLVSCLAGNAVTYTPPGGRVFVTLTEGEVQNGGRRTYRCVVEDNGVGIGEEFLQRIFEPFARERNTTLSGVSGMGLGLTIAKYIAERMGGTIQADSTEGQGSVFTATVQLQTGEKAAHGARAGAGQLSGLRILLVEDNEINREIETALLQNEGFWVDIAEDGSVAVEKAKNPPPGGYGLILMDIQMPVMDGWQAAQAIRSLEDPALAEVPIIALSANAFESDVRRSLESGMNAHLTKPIDVACLIEEIKRAVGKNS